VILNDLTEFLYKNGENIKFDETKPN